MLCQFHTCEGGCVDAVTGVKGLFEERALVCRWDVELEARIRAHYADLVRQKDTRTSKPACLVDRMLLPQVQTGRPLDDRTLNLTLVK